MGYWADKPLPVRANADHTPGAYHMDVVDLDTGERLTCVRAVDTRKGFIIRYVTDGDGHMALDRARDRAKRELVRGRFDLRWGPHA